MSRKKSRDLSFKIVFASLFQGFERLASGELNVEEVFDLESFLQEYSLTRNDVEYGVALAQVTLKNGQTLLNELKDSITGYSLDRVNRPELAILLLALAELRYMQDAEIKVVINEAVELAKSYGAEKGYKFVHSVLAKLVK